MREAINRLPIALRPHAPLAPAHEFERERRRTFRHERGRALLRQAFRPELVELAQPLRQLRFAVGEIAVAAGGAKQQHAAHALRMRSRKGAGHQATERIADQHHVLQ